MKKQSYIDLVSEVKAHDYHYFIENSPVISDEDLLNIIDNALDEEEPTTVPEGSPSGAKKLLCGALALVAMVGLATVGLGLAAFGIPVLGGFLLKT